MPQEINYKVKYKELRSKYINDLDTSFRLGYEAGSQAAQQQQALDAQAQAKESEMQQKQLESQGGQPGKPGSEMPQEDPNSVQDSENPVQNEQGSELDQHINKLESMLGSNPNPEMQKSLQAIISLRKSEKQALEMKKAEQAIKGIAKALHKPGFKVGVQASHNLTDNAKRTLSLQQKIVTDVMKAWTEEESKASKDISKILDVEGLIKE